MRTFALCLWFCLLLMPTLAQARSEALHPALWKVTRQGTTIWLFGTIHMLPADADWLNGAVAQAADGADEIATEIDDPDGRQTREALAARAMLPAGAHLSEMLPSDERAALAERLGRFGVPMARIDGDKPWYAAATLSTLPLLRLGYNAHNGVEAQLYTREAARKVARVGIETPDEQLGMLDGLPRASQLAFLKSVIDDFDQVDGQIAAMMTAWGKGDADTLARLMIEDDGKDDPILIERLITLRNQRFADWIARRLTRPGNVFMAIGAGHLAGPNSVQDDLARAGITAVRVQ